MSNEFKLVPVELLVRWEENLGTPAGRQELLSSLQDMLAAAPQPPALGGEPEARQAFDDWFRKDLGLPDCANTTFIGGAREPWRAWQACSNVYRAHLAPLQAEVERWKAISAVQKDRMDVALELAKEHREERDQLKARNAELEQLSPKAFLPTFATKVIKKLQRFKECIEDGQCADIGKIWFDLLTHLELLKRVQRSPAVWEITKQGEDLLSGGVNEPTPFCFIEDHSHCFLENRTKETRQAWRLNISTHRISDSDVPLYRFTKPAGSEQV